MVEKFRPVNNTPPSTLLGKLKFYGRMLLDLQALTVYRDVRKIVPSFAGTVLDVGCGQSPYRFLLDPSKVEYVGVDIVDAAKFDYDNPDIVPFDGEHLPFPDESFSGVICTEVLEHVQHYQTLIDEMFRTMKRGAAGIVTVPWSARFHYVPYDYFRYTPSSLETMFSAFRNVQVKARGTDIVTIVSKLVVVWARNIVPVNPWRFIFVPLWLVLLPVLAIAVLVGHIALIVTAGSTDDPLGYTIVFRK